MRIRTARGLKTLAAGWEMVLGLGAQTPFRIGVAPHTSTRVILELYQPLRLHLEKELGGPAEILTAPDFTEFARRSLHHEYDLVITTGHQARLLEIDTHTTEGLVILAAGTRLSVVHIEKLRTALSFGFIEDAASILTSDLVA